MRFKTEGDKTWVLLTSVSEMEDDYRAKIKSLESRLAESEKLLFESEAQHYEKSENNSCRCISLGEALAQRAFERDQALKKLTHTEETLNKAIVIIKELLETAECHLDDHFEFLAMVEQKEMK